MKPIFLALSVVSLVLVGERLARLRRRRSTLTDRVFLVGLFVLSVTSAVYAVSPLISGFYNIGLATWHVLVAVLIGCLDMLVLSLRVRQVSTSALCRVVLRCAAISATLAVTWMLGFAHSRPVDNLSALGPQNLADLLHMTLFPAYIIFGLMKVIALCRARLPHDVGRRPISALSLLLIALGCAGFIWINVWVIANLLADREIDYDWLLAPSPVYVAAFVVGAGLLSVGERTHEELKARLMLRRLKPLWSRMIEELPEGAHLPADGMPAAVRLQRAYIEISDGLCTMKVEAAEPLTIDAVVRRLHSDRQVQSDDAPTLSQVLPARVNRTEDLQMIHTVAEAYRGSLR